MRRIVKTCILSVTYKEWHDAMEAAGENHPEYTSRYKYYLDVVMNLFHCQRGLCAYTEVLLCTEADYRADNWVAGQYTADKPQSKGQLEHFDTTLKAEKGWLWDNLFMVDSDINTKTKRTRAVDPILKPDAEDYDPFERLEYNTSMHIFIAKSSLSDELKARIDEMILTLGLNHTVVKQLRIARLSALLKAIEFNIETWDDASPVEFPTAFEMIKRKHATQANA